LGNGSIAASRILNAARSPRATVYINLKFDINIPYKKIETFKDVVTKFVKDRPREWAAFNGFRAVSVEVDRNYIAYKIVLTHRQAWQKLVDILTSKAAVASYCLEVQKKMGMTYEERAIPVNISAAAGSPSEYYNDEDNNDDFSIASSNESNAFDLISKMFMK